MAQVTSIEWKSERKRNARVYVDGEHWLTLPGEVIEWLLLYEGRQIPDEELPELEQRAHQSRAKLFCLRSLSAKAQSRSELEKKLAQREVPEEMAAKVLDGLQADGYLDDREYARQLAENTKTRGYGRDRAWQKLFRAGVDRELVQEVLDEVFDDPDDQVEAALKALTKRRRDDAPHKSFAFLVRRGFGSDVAWRAICRRNEELDLVED